MQILNLEMENKLGIVRTDLALRIWFVVDSRETSKSHGLFSPHAGHASQLLVLLLDKFDRFKDLESGCHSVGRGDGWNDLACHLFDLEKALLSDSKTASSEVGCCSDELNGVLIILTKNHGANFTLSREVDVRNHRGKVLNLSFKILD